MYLKTQKNNSMRRTIECVGMSVTKKIIIIISISVIVASSIIIPLTINHRQSNLPVDLSSASKTVRIDDRMYTLEVYLWRDFMPGVEPNGTHLLVVLNIIAEGDIAFPANIDAEKMWVINGEEIWNATLENVISFTASNILRKRADGGPKWGPGIKVDVIVELFSSSGDKYYLLAKDQYINITW